MTFTLRSFRALGFLQVLLFGGLSSEASAAVINFSVVNVSGNDWQYSYTVSGHVFQAGELFEIQFDELLYINLQDPPPPVPGWDIFVIQPETTPLALPGLYFPLALVNSASLANPFVIQFTYLGAGTPGSQPFTIYDDQFNPIETGQTIEGPPIPEPGPMILLCTGLLVVLGWRESIKRSKRLS